MRTNTDALLDVVSPAAWQESSIATIRSCTLRLQKFPVGQEDVSDGVVWQWREEISVTSNCIVYSW